MSFLAPLFMLGALAVAAPVLFHLIRRSPQGKMPFSTLMFLSPSPPRLTKRSRLDHLLLLLLRAAAFCLLAFAFARPFLREAEALDRGDANSERVLLLVDTSASMRRGDLWSQATARAQTTLNNLGPHDEIAVYAFDGATRPVATFAELAALEPAQRKAVAIDRVQSLVPTWRATDLGAALVEAIGAVNEGTDATEQSARGPRRVVLISDLAQGSRTEALTDFEWPRDVELELQTVSAAGGNAGASVLIEDVEAAPDASGDLRVRIANDPGAEEENLQLAWQDDEGNAASSIAVYVPPGESRVARVPRPADPGKQRRLQLTGDAHAFDNTLFVATRPRESVEVLYLGADAANDPAGMLYFAERALGASPRRDVTVKAFALDAELPALVPRATPLVILTGETTPANREKLLTYLEAGGTVLDVLDAAGMHETLAALARANVLESTDSETGQYAMLSQIDFKHPLFAPLAAPQYNDFTKIQFLRYRRLPAGALADAHVVARFEGDDPAILEQLVGKGRLVIFTFGWRPADSQLARSSKFVPIMQSLLERHDALDAGARSYAVGERVRLPVRDADETLVITLPDGATRTVAASEEFFADTEQPGVYVLTTPDETQYFAVNVDPLESRTAPVANETLEQWGALLTSDERREIQAEQTRQLRDVELEGRQKLWQWLVAGVLGVLIVETWLAGRLSRAVTNPAEAAVS
jgi:Mg-chelatase subunit ChlD